MLAALSARVPRVEFEFRRRFGDEEEDSDEDEERGKEGDDYESDDDDDDGNGNAKDVAMTPPKGHATMETTEKTKKKTMARKIASFEDGAQSDEEGGEEEEMLLFGTIGSTEKTIEIDVTKCAEQMSTAFERCKGLSLSLLECAKKLGRIGRNSGSDKRMSGKRWNNGAYERGGDAKRRGQTKADMRNYYVESRKKIQKPNRRRRLFVPRVLISAFLFWMILYLWYRKRTMMSSDELGNGTKRRGESESMKNARMEVAAMKRGDFGRQETEDQATYQTTFSGGIFPSHERVGSAEYDRETERLMEALAKRIATGQHQSADFNDARRHVREHRMNGSSGRHRNNNLVHLDNAEVMRLREVKRQLRDDFLQMGPKCEFDTSGMSRQSIKDMKEECKEFFREESKRIEKIPLLDDTKYKIHGENQLNREHFRGHRLPIEIKSMDMVPH